MPFVKLDCKMLDSSIWPEKNQRDLFITALLMAQPFELMNSEEQLKVRSLESTGFKVPAGWYGFVPAAGIGIINRCGMDQEEGLDALEKLGDPDSESRSSAFEGRRLVRIDGGYLALNYDKYRERDYSNAERCKRYRDKLKKKNDDMACQGLQHACQHVSDMQAEAEAEAEEDKNKEGFEDKENHSNKEKVKNKFKPPSKEEVESYGKEIGFSVDGEAFLAYYTACGWLRGKSQTPIKDWKSCVVTWKRTSKNKGSSSKNLVSSDEILKEMGVK